MQHLPRRPDREPHRRQPRTPSWPEPARIEELEQLLRRHRAGAGSVPETARCRLVRWWSDDGAMDLHALVASEDGRPILLIDDAPFTTTDIAGAKLPAGLEAIARERGRPVVDLDAPLALAPVRIAKAWGAEHWYTGMEARGESAVTDDNGAMPLTWLTSLLPQRVLGRSDPAPLLVKRLEALPEPVTGELYFEVHAQKEEFYVALEADRRAWPDGATRLRLAPGLTACRDAFTAAVERWGRALAEGRPDLGSRAALDEFLDIEVLAPGSGVHLPAGAAHGLLHGARVLEIQTPAYERGLLFSGQDTPTPDTWRTAASLDLVRDSVRARCFDDSASTVDAAGFVLRRLGPGLHRLSAGAGAEGTRKALEGPYAVVILRCGSATLSSGRRAVLTLGAEDGALLPTPALAAGVDLEVSAHGEALVATPR